MPESKRRRARRANGEGSVYRRGDRGTWVAQVPVGLNADGSYRFKRYTCATQAAAMAKLRAAQEALDRGADLGAKSQTLGAFLDAWLADVVRRDAEPKTYEGYAYTVGLIKPSLGRVPLDKLTPQHVQKLLNELLEQGGEGGKGLSPRTVQYARATLRRALGQALKWGLVTRNVATLVEPPKSRRAEVQPFSEEEARALLAAARGDRLEALYAVALTLGLRQGELLGLRWEDLDLDRGVLRVRQQLQHMKREQPVLKGLKTRSSRRDMELPARLALYLRAHWARQRREREGKGDAWREHGLVFPSAVGTPMTPRNLVRRFQDLLGRAGLPARRFHDLRHTAASLMFERGLEATTVQRVLGHSSIAVTNDTYLHLMPQAKRRSAEVMDDVLSAPEEESVQPS
jgi:integrase